MTCTASHARCAIVKHSAMMCVPNYAGSKVCQLLKVLLVANTKDVCALFVKQ